MVYAPSLVRLAPQSKCLAQSNKSPDQGNATNKRAIRQPGRNRSGE
jgi:hypothetical protein